MTDLEKALHDPAAVYSFPRDVLSDEALTVEQKRQVLEQWLVDAKNLAVADEENMAGDGPCMLSRVQRCLSMLLDEGA